MQHGQISIVYGHFNSHTRSNSLTSDGSPLPFFNAAYIMLYGTTAKAICLLNDTLTLIRHAIVTYVKLNVLQMRKSDYKVEVMVSSGSRRRTSYSMPDISILLLFSIMFNCFLRSRAFANITIIGDKSISVLAIKRKKYRCQATYITSYWILLSAVNTIYVLAV